MLETLLAADRALLGANTGVLDRLEADFRLVDEAHASVDRAAAGLELAETWKIGIVDWPDEAAALKRLLKNDHPTAATLNAAAPHLARPLAPVWLVSPYEVPEHRRRCRVRRGLARGRGRLEPRRERRRSSAAPGRSSRSATR